MNKRLYSIFLLLISLALFSCREDSFTTNPSAQLNFSTKEVFFDTLFKTISSSTRRFKVYNPHSKSIKISSIDLMGGSASKFRINIDGQPGSSSENITIRPKDSLYIFAEVTIDQSNSNNPFIVKDSIRFITNGNAQFVNLLAYGRKAVIHKQAGISSSTTWNSDLPHLIVDYAIVDSNVTLTIEEGTEIYSTGNSSLFVFGSLQVDGSHENPVYFQGARPEGEYKNVPGQWQGIRLLPSSKNNFIHNAIINEGTVGIEVDSFAPNNIVKLDIRNTRISNMSRTGIAAFTTNIFALNTIISEGCGNLVTARFGGSYQFIHCTFMASSCQCSPQGPALLFTNENYQRSQGGPIFPFDLNVLLLNSIVWGFQEDELNIVNQGKGEVTASISHSILKTSQETFDGNGNLINKDPLLENVCNYNFSLQANSPALNSGQSLAPLKDQNPQLPLERDFNNNTRDTANPDIGAIEKQE